MTLGCGNGYSLWSFAKYSPSISVVRVFSLYVPDACPFVPLMLIILCSKSMLFLCVLCSSCPSAPVSTKMVKIVAYRFVDADIIFSMLAVVGIMGVFASHLYLGASHWSLFALHRQE